MSSAMKSIEQDLTVPGFSAHGVHAGIKQVKKKDLALFFSEIPATAAGVFTSNAFKAAPVLLDVERIKKGRAQAIIVNSGNANAATGAGGYRDALEMGKTASEFLKINENLVLVASTGIIGRRLPMKKIKTAMGPLVKGLRPGGITDAEEGIMTTDRFPKIAFKKLAIGGKEVSICGVAKGAGMIEPNMATLLSFILTDAEIEQDTLDMCLRKGVDCSFNSITVDGCMSTNDSVIILANGRAGNKKLKREYGNVSRFNDALISVLKVLALAIVRDGEGSTKVIRIFVEGAKSDTEAKIAAFAVARSNLVKTAFFGKDPNWGRIISAVGASGIKLRTEKLELYFDGVPLFIKGLASRPNKKKLAGIMEKEQVNVQIKLACGNGSYTAYASDLGYDYIKINADYHT